VTRVSWFEAAAYAEFMGKELPTVYHWQQAALYMPIASDVISLSNFAGKDPAAPGLLPGRELLRFLRHGRQRQVVLER